ncbi:MAG: HAMP domain-containing sensor histidine kinase, partial [Phycisphaerae bacterium]
YFVFATALYLMVYMANYVSTILKQTEQSLLKANKALCQKDRIKDEYVLRVTHDIKGHLSTIQSCLDVVISGLTGLLNEQQAEFINRAFNRTVKVIHFVKSLLKLTQMRLISEFEVEKFSLKSTIENALAMVKSKAQDKSITLNSDIELPEDSIIGSQFSIEELITNLLLNAIKYTAAGGKIEIDVRDKEDCVLVEVVDTGIGIPEDELPKVFDEFYRATNAKKLEKDGTGLGLAIAKQIVEKHHGKIWVDSREGIGTKFSFTLPKTDYLQTR